MKRQTTSPHTRQASRTTKSQPQASASQQASSPNKRSRVRLPKPSLTPDLMAKLTSIIHRARPKSNAMGEQRLYDKIVRGLIHSNRPHVTVAFMACDELAGTLQVKWLSRAIDKLTARLMYLFARDQMVAWSAVEHSTDPAFVGRCIADAETSAVVAQQIRISAVYRREKSAQETKAPAKKAKAARAAARRARTAATAAPTEASRCTHTAQQPNRPLDILSLISLHPKEFNEFTNESLVLLMLRGQRKLSLVQGQIWTCLVPCICRSGREVTAHFTRLGLMGNKRAIRRQISLKKFTQAASLLRLRNAFIHLKMRLLKRLSKSRKRWAA